MGSARLKEWCPGYGRPIALCFVFPLLHCLSGSNRFCRLVPLPQHAPGLAIGLYVQSPGGALSRAGLRNYLGFSVMCRILGFCTTLIGGSLGSCVDEERSQLCELM